MRGLPVLTLTALLLAAPVLAGCMDGTGSLTVTSAAFDDGQTIPQGHTCDGADESPPLSVSGLPGDTQVLALIADDPDAPGGTFTHWIVWNVPPDRTSWPAGIGPGDRATELGDAPQGTNDAGEVGYSGPCPPEGDGPHTYRFTFYALDGDLGLDPGAGRSDLESAMDGRVLDSGRLTGEYGR